MAFDEELFYADFFYQKYVFASILPAQKQSCNDVFKKVRLKRNYLDFIIAFLRCGQEGSQRDVVYLR
jgi:hypothetical protein